jgi:hypothetical protein
MQHGAPGPGMYVDFAPRVHYLMLNETTTRVCYKVSELHTTLIHVVRA